jgi:hypothetical protein
LTNKKSVAKTTLFLFVDYLRFFDCAYGTSVFARAAIYALVVDYVNTFRLVKRNRAYGTGICASAAS